MRDDAAAIEAFGRAVEPCLARAAELGVTLLIENEFNAHNRDPCRSDVTRDPARLRALFEHVDHASFGLTYDATNFAIAGAVHELIAAADRRAELHLRRATRESRRPHGRLPRCVSLRLIVLL